MLFGCDKVTVYTIFTGPSSLPCVVTDNEAVADSLSTMFAVALGVLIVTAALLLLLIVAVTVSVASTKTSSITGKVYVPVLAPAATVILVPAGIAV